MSKLLKYKSNSRIIGKLHGVNIKLDAGVPEGQFFVMNATTQWIRRDLFVGYIPCKNRLLTAWRALITGMVKITWFANADAKDKRFRLTGKHEDLWRR